MAVRSFILVLAAQALTAMPAFACGGDGGGHGGGGGFHGGGGFRGGSGFHGRDRFDRLGFFGDFGFACPCSRRPHPPATTYWYYCGENNGYYPYTQQCPGGWRAVPTTAMG
jgi:hypothetical protein